MSQEITSFKAVHALLDGLRPEIVKRPAYTDEFIIQALDFLGNPQEAMRVVHLAGTSGKTSTAYYIAALLQAAGLRVGLSVSPHLIELNERVQINLEPLPEKQYCAAFSQFWHLIQKSDIALTRFELLVAFQFWYFAREHVDVAVIEAGMGGLLDATNVVNRRDKVCVITDIGFDHVRTLGPKLADIAAHKAGIIHAGNSVFCYEQSPEITEMIMSRARQKHADLYLLAEEATASQFAFLPPFQQRNFGLAQAVAAYVLEGRGAALSPPAVEQAARTQVPGRMQIFSYKNKTLILDGAHNPQKLRALLSALHSRYPRQTVALLAAFVATDAERVRANAKILAAFSGPIVVTGFMPTDYDSHQSFPPEAVGHLLSTQGSKGVEVIPQWPKAFEALLARPESVIVATGSLYFLSRLIQYIAPE